MSGARPQADRAGGPTDPSLQAVSAEGAHPSREGMLPRATYASCPICYGTGTTSWGACETCADPDPALARKVLERLHPDQMRFLRAFGHTLAKQPVTGGEWDSQPIRYYVEDDDGEIGDDYDWLIPPTRHWFASAEARMGPCGFMTFIRYNPLGLLLRECLMAGADTNVASYHPSDSDASLAEDRASGLSGEAVAARAEGIAQ